MAQTESQLEIYKIILGRKTVRQIIREKAVIATYQKLLVDTNEDEIREYLNSDNILTTCSGNCLINLQKMQLGHLIKRN